MEVTIRDRGIQTPAIVIVVLLFVTTSVLTVFVPDNVRSEEVSGDIIFDEDSDFIGSPYIDSGSGTPDDPYVISDLSMGDNAIHVKNITKYIIFRNITFYGDTYSYTYSYRQAFFIYGAKGLIFENITVNANRGFLKIFQSTEISIIGLQFFGRAQVIYAVGFSNIAIINSTFDFPYYHSEYNFMSIGSATQQISMTGNLFNNTLLYISSMGMNNLMIKNNTFHYSSIQLSLYDCTINQNREIKNNHFYGFNIYLGCSIWLSNSYGCDIFNNLFENTIGLSLTILNYFSGDINQIHNNTFISCKSGIRMEWYNPTHPPVEKPYAKIKDNHFINGSLEAIKIEQKYVGNLIYNNYFINNNNNNAQALDLNDKLPLNQWNHSGIGNYWSDHTGPDNDGDGVVDVPYNVGTTNDSYPSSNIHWDRKRPQLDVHYHPNPCLLKRSYIWTSWNASDEYGIAKYELSLDNKTWTNVTGSLRKSVYITPEHDHFYIRATDGNGLFKVHHAEFDIDKEYSPIEVIHPVHGTYIPDDPLILSWSIEDYFNVTKQTFTIDSVRTNISASARTFKLDLKEGAHSATVTITDEDGLTLTKTVDFIVDRNAPNISVMSPRPDSVLSNQIVNISHTVSDEVDLVSAHIRFDSGDWTDIMGKSSTSKLLLEGEHLIELKAEDAAGHISEMKIPITIGEDTNIEFISPTPGEFTNKGTYIVEWDYSGPLEWVNAELRVGKETELFDIGSQKSIEVTLPREGTFEITLRLNDAYDNYCERTSSLIRDIKPPLLFLKDIGEFVNTGDYLLEWNPQDYHGIDRSMVKLDDGDWVDAGSSTSQLLRLEDGPHSVEVMVFDMAGNLAEVSDEFIVDTVLPIVTIKEPVNDIYSNKPTMTVLWTVYDEHDINVTTLTLNDGNPIDVTGSTSYSITTSTEGTSTIVIFSQDMAGNLGREQVSFIIDLTPPSIEWKNLPNENFKEPKLILEWTVNDNIALDSLSLSYNDETLTIDIDRTKIELDLEEGLYTFTLKATDKAGNSRSTKLDTDINIDRTRPALDLVETGCSVEGNMMTIEWTCDDGSGIDRIEVSMDGGEFSELEIGKTSTTLGPFESGPHNVRIRAFDLAGNMEERTWNFNIEKEAEASEDGGGTLIAVIIIVIVIIVLVVIGVVIFLMTRKKKGEDTTKTEVKTDQEVLPPNGQTPQEALPPADAKEKDASIAPKLRPTTIPVLPPMIPAPIQQPPINAQTPQSANGSKIVTPSGDATYTHPRK